tara:strand:- start:756 stop:1037 length:282 start_codon:yes stop_codon:yes gene_type:complete
MTTNQHDDDLIDSDNAQAWHQHNELLRQQQEESQCSYRESIERLTQAAAILDVLQPQIQTLRTDLIALRDDLIEKNKRLADDLVTIARNNGLL